MRGLPFHREMEEECRRVSARLHSSLTPSLAALTANLDLIATHGVAVPAARRGLLEETRVLARDCFQQVRALADELYPPIVADLGLCRAVAAAVAAYNEQARVPVACETDPRYRLPEEIEMAVYRLVLDCLDDLRLAGGNVKGSVTLRSTRRRFELAITPATLDSGIRWRRYLGSRFAAKVDARLTRRGGALSLVVNVPVALTR